MQAIDQFNGKENLHGMYFMHKRNVDYKNNELARAVRLAGKSANYVSFKVRRAGGTFDPDLFPPCAAKESAHAFDDWIGGANKPPILQTFDPNAIQDNDASKRQALFKRKVTLGEKAGAFIEEEQKQSSVSAPLDNSAEVRKLEQQIKDLLAQNISL